MTVLAAQAATSALPKALPAVTGGNAGPSSAESNNRIDFGNVLTNVSTGGGLFLSIAAIIGMILWYRKSKK